jgi:hypothetical protein
MSGKNNDLKDTLHARLTEVMAGVASAKNLSRRTFADLARIVATTHVGDAEQTILLNTASEMMQEIGQGTLPVGPGVSVVRLLLILAGAPHEAEKLDPEAVAAIIEGSEKGGKR